MIYAAPRIRRQRLAGIIPHLLFYRMGLCLLALDRPTRSGTLLSSPHQSNPKRAIFVLIDPPGRLALCALSLFWRPLSARPPLLYDPAWMRAPPRQYPCQYKQSCKHTCSRCGPSFKLVAKLLYVLYISVCKCIAASVGDFFFGLPSALLVQRDSR